MTFQVKFNRKVTRRSHTERAHAVKQRESSSSRLQVERVRGYGLLVRRSNRTSGAQRDEVREQFRRDWAIYLADLARSTTLG